MAMISGYASAVPELRPTLMDHFSTDNRRQHRDASNAIAAYGEQVVAEDHDVGELASLERPLVAILKFGGCRSARGRAQRLSDRHVPTSGRQSRHRVQRQ